METLWQDLRYGARMLWKNKSFTIVSVTALALGIGFNTAIFSVVDTVLLRPLAYREPERLVSVWESNVRAGMARSEMAPANYLDLRAQNQVFEQVGAFLDQSITLTGRGEPERLDGQSVSANVLTLLGVQPLAGRTFLPNEDQPGQHQVVVLSYGLWQRRFNRDSGIVGQQITLDGQPFTVVGIMPRGFFFPQRDSELWTPLAMGPEQASGRGDHYLRVIARLKPGVSAHQAQAETESLAARLAADYPRTNEGLTVFINSLQDDYVGELRPALLILFGSVGLVLLIACANVANLLLARSTTRQREVAIRSALGAERWRIARQLMTESLLLASLGGLIGLLIAIWGVEFLLRLVPQTLSQVQGISIDGRVLLFTLFISLLTGIIFGVVPALQASGAQPGDSLKERTSGMHGSRGRHLLSALVVAEVAVALVLLVGAGLLLRSFQRLNQVDLGFRTENLLTMRTVLPGAKYPKPEQRRAFYDEVLRRVEGLPGVESAAVISFLPLSFSGMNFVFTIEGRPAVSDVDLPLAVYRVVSPDYFRTMGISSLRGRSFDQHDTADAPPVVVVNRSLADQFWPAEDAVGKRLKVGPADSPNPWATVIGVVGDVRQVGLQGDQRLEMYATYKQDPRGFIAPRDLVVRSKDADPGSLAAAVREQVWAVDKDQPVSNVRTMQQVFGTAVSRERFQTLLLGLFAALALLLAVVGLYGVMSYAVTQRTHEIGVRMALGAQRGQVLRLIIRQGMTLTLIGVVVGLGVAMAVTRLITGILYRVTATDPITFITVATLLALVAFFACYIPARRATKVDPLVALRYE